MSAEVAEDASGCSHSNRRADCLGTFGKFHAGGYWNLAMRLGTRVGQFVDRLAFRIERLMFGPVVEGKPVHVIHEGFCGSILGED